MKALLVSAITLLSINASAYTFSFDYAQAFKTEDQMKERVELLFSRINSSYLKDQGLEVKLISVTKSFPTHTIKGEMTGIGCTPSQTQFNRIDVSRIEYPLGVEGSMLWAIGLVLPLRGPYYDSQARWDYTLLVPACLK